MFVQISRWGNSLGLRLPRSMAEQIGVGVGGRVEIVCEGDRLIVRAAKPRRTLDDLLANMTPERMSEAFDWGDNLGRERIED